MSNLKISYRYAVHLTLILFIFAMASDLTLEFLTKNVPYLESEPLLSIIKYVFPFALLFGYIYINNQKDFVPCKKPSKALRWDVYMNALLVMIFTILLNEYITDFITQKVPSLERIDLKEQLIHPVGFFISAVLLAPFCEELFFRGILLKGLLSNNISPVKAILFSSFLFGAIHLNLWQFIGALLPGSLIGLIYFRTRSLLLCILLHGFNNGLCFFIELFNKQETISQWIGSRNFIGWTALICFSIVMQLFFLQTRQRFKRGPV